MRRASSGEEPLSFCGLRGMPRFRAKGDISFTTNAQYPSGTHSLKQPTVRLCGDMVHIPKCKEDIRLVMYRPLPEGSVIRSVTVSQDTGGELPCLHPDGTGAVHGDHPAGRDPCARP